MMIIKEVKKHSKKTQEAAVAVTPELGENEGLIRETTSICPECYRVLPATIFERGNKLWIRKNVPSMEK